MGGPEIPWPIGAATWHNAEALHAHHFYASYVFDQAEGRQQDVVTVVAEARRLGYPVRYWWLSDAMELGDTPERLIVCVHHPQSGQNAGMDLYEALTDRRVSWDALDAATLEEYALLSRPIAAPDGIRRPDGTVLFPQVTWPAENARSAERPARREDETVTAISVGDVAQIARDTLSRDLTNDELNTVIARLSQVPMWGALVLAAIGTCMSDGTITPLASDDPLEMGELQPPESNPDLPQPLAPEGRETEFLVSYSLSGLTLVPAPDVQKANDTVSRLLRALISKMGAQGLSAQEANQLRLGELDFAIDSAEALEFPTEDP